MKKRSLLLCLALVLSMTVAIGGTLAYLTDTETTTNVMVVGNVDIKIEEVFDPNQPLYPAVEDTEGNMIGTITKEVTIKNEGSSDAYVRTIVAFPELNGKPVTLDSESPIVVDYNTNLFKAEDIEVKHDVEINGREYTLMTFTYVDALKVDGVTAPSLKSFYMNPNVTNADLKDFDGTYRVLVSAQAVQTTNFESFGAAYALDKAFGAVAENGPWADVTTPVVMNGETVGKHLVGDGTTVITSTYQINNNKVDSFIIDAGVGNAATASRIFGDNEFNDCVFIAEGTNRAFWADDVEEGATIVFNNCSFKSAIKLGGNETNKYVFNNCSFSGLTDWSKGLITSYSPIELNNCTFDHSAGAKYDVYKAVGMSTAAVTVKGEGSVIVAGKATNDSELVVEVLTKDSKHNYKPVNDSAALTEALDTAKSGDIVKVEASTVEMPDVPAGVTIEGNGVDSTTLTSPAANGFNAAAGSVIKDVTIQDTNETNGRYYKGVVNLRGDGATLENVAVEGKGGTTWDAAVYVNLKAGETAYMKNVTVNGGFRGVFLGSQSGSLVMENCTINPSAYTISIDGAGDFILDVKNSTLNGWLSYSAIKSATFEGCTFGSNGSYAFYRPYSASTLINCEFETGYEIDTSEAGVTLVNCTYDGTKLTTENAGALFGGTVPSNVTIQ